MAPFFKVLALLPNRGTGGSPGPHSVPRVGMFLMFPPPGVITQ